MGHVTKMVLSMPFRVTSLPTFASVSNHESYMKRCLELAALGIGKVAPNPMVGCVIVHNDKIIGEGYHQQYGQAHAEVNAINAVQDKSLLTESTLYVNLEPCAHHGKTPPCADLIVQHKLKHVVICNRDPFAEVDGKGIAKLEAAGIDPVLFGLTDKDYELLSKNFAQIRQKLQETNSLLEEYKKYYEGEENADSN